MERSRRMVALATIFVFAFPAAHLFAQDPGTVPDAARVTPQPYTQVFRDNEVKFPGAGTLRSYETTYMQAEDSHHRRFALDIHYPQSGSGEPSIHGSIFDGENGTTTYWDNRTMRVVVANWPPEEQRHGCWQTDAGIPRMGFPPPVQEVPNLLLDGGQTADDLLDSESTVEKPVGPTRENLGLAKIQGVEAFGERFTWPATTDEAANARRPFVTSERWVSTGSCLLVSMVVEYPFKPGWTKKYSHELVKQTMGEPDAKMFAPPDGYDVVTEEMHEVPCGDAQWPVPPPQ